MALKTGVFKVRWQKQGTGVDYLDISKTEDTKTTSKAIIFYPRGRETGGQNQVPTNWQMSGFSNMLNVDTIISIKNIHLDCWLSSTVDDDYASKFWFYDISTLNQSTSECQSAWMRVGANLKTTPLHYAYDTKSSWRISTSSGMLGQQTKLNIQPAFAATQVETQPFITYNQTDKPYFIEITFESDIDKDGVEDVKGLFAAKSSSTFKLTQPRVFDGEDWIITQPKLWNGEEWVDLAASAYDN